MSDTSRDGEYILLWWEGGTPDVEYIRGHVSREMATDVLRNQGILYKDEEIGSACRVVHCYGRWACDASQEHDHTLYTYPARGRGRFPITAIEFLAPMSAPRTGARGRQ